jgi:hypothetical protein
MSNRMTEEVPVNRFSTWPCAGSLPPDPTVTISFCGLMAFCYNTGSWCEVGFPHADGRHQLKITVREDNVPLNLSQPSSIDMMSIGILDGIPNVRFLKSRNYDDFRWVLDLEGDEFYPRHPDMKSDFNAKLIVNQGTFFTERRTWYELAKIKRPLIELPGQSLNGPTLNHPADIIGASIELEENEELSFIIDDREFVRLPRKRGSKYKIRFCYECTEGTEPCHFVSDHWQESNRNDFYYLRKLLSLKLLEARYGVAIAPGQIHKGELKHERPNECFDMSVPMNAVRDQTWLSATKLPA